MSKCPSCAGKSLLEACPIGSTSDAALSSKLELSGGVGDTPWWRSALDHIYLARGSACLTGGELFDCFTLRLRSGQPLYPDQELFYALLESGELHGGALAKAPALPSELRCCCKGEGGAEEDGGVAGLVSAFSSFALGAVSRLISPPKAPPPSACSWLHPVRAAALLGSLQQALRAHCPLVSGVAVLLLEHPRDVPWQQGAQQPVLSLPELAARAAELGPAWLCSSSSSTGSSANSSSSSSAAAVAAAPAYPPQSPLSPAILRTLLPYALHRQLACVREVPQLGLTVALVASEQASGAATASTPALLRHSGGPVSAALAELGLDLHTASLSAALAGAEAAVQRRTAQLAAKLAGSGSLAAHLTRLPTAGEQGEQEAAAVRLVLAKREVARLQGVLGNLERMKAGLVSARASKSYLAVMEASSGELARLTSSLPSLEELAQLQEELREGLQQVGRVEEVLHSFNSISPEQQAEITAEFNAAVAQAQREQAAQAQAQAQAQALALAQAQQQVQAQALAQHQALVQAQMQMQQMALAQQQQQQALAQQGQAQQAQAHGQAQQASPAARAAQPNSA